MPSAACNGSGLEVVWLGREVRGTMIGGAESALDVKHDGQTGLVENGLDLALT